MTEAELYYNPEFDPEKNLELESLLHEFPTLSGLDFTVPYFFQKNTVGRNYTKKDSHGVRTVDLLQHIRGDKTIALPRYPTSKIVIIDVDQRSQPKDVETKYVVEKLVEHLGEPFYIEFNPSTSGYHLYWEFEDYLQPFALQVLTDYFSKKYNQIIEPKLNREIIRIPFSQDYRIFGVFSKRSFNRIATTKITFSEVVRLFRERKQVSIPKFLDTANKKGLAPTFTLNSSSSSNSSHQEKLQSLRYGYGTRHLAQPKIAFFVLQEGKDFEEFERLCHELNDGTSKDMKKDSRKVESMLRNLWKNAAAAYNSEFATTLNKRSRASDVEKFADELLEQEEGKIKPLIYDPDFTYLSVEQTDLVLDQLEAAYETLYSVPKTRSPKRFNEVVESGLFVYRVMFSKAKHKESTQRTYTSELLTPFNAENVTFVSYDMKLRFSKAHQIKNIDRILKLLEVARLITPVAAKNNRLFSNAGERFSRHWRVNNPEEVKFVKEVVILPEEPIEDSPTSTAASYAPHWMKKIFVLRKNPQIRIRKKSRLMREAFYFLDYVATTQESYVPHTTPEQSTAPSRHGEPSKHKLLTQELARRGWRTFASALDLQGIHLKDRLAALSKPPPR